MAIASSRSQRSDPPKRLAGDEDTPDPSLLAEGCVCPLGIASYCSVEHSHPGGGGSSVFGKRRVFKFSGWRRSRGWSELTSAQ